VGDIKLFQIEADSARELRAESVDNEKSLQSFIERHLESFLGVRFLATEYVTGKAHGRRIDTLGLDKNNCPVIIEYKRALHQNVINQGLHYLAWLMDHKGEFTLEVQKRLGPSWSEQIDWSAPRLLCIAGDFSPFDEAAVRHNLQNIELLRYRRYGGDLLMLELVGASATVSNQPHSRASEAAKVKIPAMRTLRPESKGAKVLELIGRSKGASLAELMKATRWQAHSVRGFISGKLGTKMGLQVVSAEREDGERVYSMAK
jgi:hypothetical protein